jgi:hypothetical protein
MQCPQAQSRGRRLASTTHTSAKQLALPLAILHDAVELAAHLLVVDGRVRQLLFVDLDGRCSCSYFLIPAQTELSLNHNFDQNACLQGKVYNEQT